MINISDLRHRITVCTAKDVVIASDEIVFARSGVYGCWAKIEPRRPSMFSIMGVAIEESTELRSHLVTIRYRSDVDFTAAAWLYEHRLKSLDRWYKVLGGVDFEDSAGHFFKMDVRLVEKAEMLTEKSLLSPVDKPVGVNFQ